MNLEFLHSLLCKAEGLCQQAAIRKGGGDNKGRLELTNWSEADKLKVPCDWLTRFMRVFSHETMKLVKMIEMLIVRLSLNASWHISGVQKSNLQFF